MAKHGLYKISGTQIRRDLAALNDGQMLSDGGGVYLKKTGEGRGKWFLRYTVGGKRRDKGLGSFPAVTLATVRELAAKHRDDIAKGVDPIAEARKAKRGAANSLVSFNDVTYDFFEKKIKPKLRNDKQTKGWISTVESYALPSIGQIPVSELIRSDFEKILIPIWIKKRATSSKLVPRLRNIIKHAANNDIDVDTGLVDQAVGNMQDRGEIAEKHHFAFPWVEVPDLYSRIEMERHGIAGALLRILILTAGARLSEIRTAQWSQFYPEERALFIPAEKNKNDGGYFLPLSRQAVAAIESLKPFETGGWIFPNNRGGHMDENAATLMFKRISDDKRATVHGLRSNFRVWCTERTDASFDQSERAIDHGRKRDVNFERDYQLPERALGAKVDSRTVRAYLRHDFGTEISALWQQWGDFIAPDNVIDFPEIKALLNAHALKQPDQWSGEAQAAIALANACDIARNDGSAFTRQIEAFVANRGLLS